MNKNKDDTHARRRSSQMEVGEKRNRLTLIEDLGMIQIKGKNKKHRLGLFLCDCGNYNTTTIYTVEKEKAKSCGCLLEEKIYTHGLSRHPIYKTYSGIFERCYNSNHSSYKNYGGRGIKICDEWLSNFSLFYNWAINNGWEKGLQVDRIDNNGNYEPNNCQIVTPAENLAIGKTRIRSDNTSGYVGVSYNKKSKRWRAGIETKDINGNSKEFDDIKKAVEYRIALELLYFGEQRTNFHYKKGCNNE